MGSLARVGISSGRKVPALGLVPEVSPVPVVDSFAWRSLSYFGFGRIAEKICASVDLSVDDVELLLSKASLPVLMKLVEFFGARPAAVLPMPVKLLSSKDELGCERLTSPFQPREVGSKKKCADELSVIFDGWSPAGSLQALLDGSKRIQEHQLPVRIVGPSIEDVVSSIVVEERRGMVCSSRLRELLCELRAAGIDTLLPGAGRGILHMLHELGFNAGVETNLDVFRLPRHLALELVRLNKEAGQAGIVQVWSPGVAQVRGGKRFSDAAADLRILRALAVGALALRNVPFVRASSLYLSNDGMKFSAGCGANDFGFGAVDRYTAANLHLENVSLLRELCNGAVN